MHVCSVDGGGGLEEARYNFLSHCQARMHPLSTIRVKQVWVWELALLYTNTVLHLLNPQLLHLQNGNKNCSLKISS